MIIKKSIYVASITLTLLSGLSCTTIPEGVNAVTSFDIAKYVGKWYEIARFDFRFERDLNNTTAEYSLNNDGTVKVINQGYNYKTNTWEKVEGKAKFAKEKNIGMLKVSFFGPFYGGYNVIALDKEYKYALVAGESLEYLWILSRETQIPQETKDEYLRIAQKHGFNISNLIWVKHDAK